MRRSCPSSPDRAHTPVTVRGLVVTLVVAAWCALVAAVVVTAVGPVAFAPAGLSISNPSRPLVVFAVLVGVVLLSRQLRAWVGELVVAPHVAQATVAIALLCTAALLIQRGAVSVGGADSAGYLAQAERWESGHVRMPVALAIPGLADPAWRQSGLGFRPDPTGTALVPSYPPGLPWLQALALRLGGHDLAVRGLPLVAAVAALAAVAMLARRHAGWWGAALASVTLATLPPFLFQALQPMSDVPALAAWLLGLALVARPGNLSLSAGAVAVLIAILIRPNLALLALPVCWQASLAVPHGHVVRMRVVAVLGAAVAGTLVVAAVQWALYGSPFQSGYGRASELFSPSHVPVNLLRYPAWLVESLSIPALTLVIVGGFALLWRALADSPLRPTLTMAALTAALYLPYVPFDSWTYLRFVLVPLALAPLGAAVLLAGLHSVAAPAGSRPFVAGAGSAWRVALSAGVVLLVGTTNLHHARHLGVFDVGAREARYRAAGTFVRDHLPQDAVIVAGQHSTSAPLYSGRPVLRADLLDAAGWRAVTDWSSHDARPLVFVLDTSEVESFRARVGPQGLAALDWPPRAEIGRPVATRVWFAADREVHRTGGRIPTTRLAPRR